MSDKFINQLPAAGALSGSEPLPVMQGTATVRTTVSSMLNQPAQSVFCSNIVMGGVLFMNGGQIQLLDAGSNQTFEALSASRSVLQFSTSDNVTYVTSQVTGTGGANLGQMNLNGALAVTQGFAANGATPQAAHTVGAAVVTTATTQTTPFGFVTQAQGDNLVALVNAMRLALVNNGICV